MTIALRIFVLWHPQSSAGKDLAEKISGHFDALGMEREGVQYRVPVRYRSEPWGAGEAPKAPRPIDLSAAEHNAIVLLHDDLMLADSDIWDPYVTGLVDDMEKRDGRDVFIPMMRTKTSPLPSLYGRGIHHAHQYKWAKSLPDDEARVKRMVLHIVYCIREHLRRRRDANAAPEPLFVSHAKADGDETARAIVDHVNDSGNDVPLNTFYDAMELMPGERFQKRFEHEIGRGTLLAIISDVYDSRPWCIYELTEAKRKRRPIVLADVGKVRTSRTYPYGANLPRVRISKTDVPAIEALLVETISEGLRCDLFALEAKAIADAKNIAAAVGLPRPPELFDLLDSDDMAGKTVLYPDPPVPNIEQRLLDNAASKLAPAPVFKTLGELR
jgi:hypothetical protein